MIIAPATTYGIDTKIKMIQSYLNSSLSWDTPYIYGRIHKTIKKVNDSDVSIPEVYISDKEYRPVFINDTQNAQIGFLVTDRDIYSASIDVIFTGDLVKIYGASSLRLDEKAIIEAKRCLDSSGFVEVEGVKIGISEVFTAFDQSRIKHRDMHPFFVFSYTCRVPYTEDYCR